jgi:biotin synthase-related radical SAM superfamily protein
MVEAAIDSGLPFMTNGCPDRNGRMTCNRPYGSYRPGEPFRDYPFQPSADDIAVIRGELRLEEIR